MDIEVLEGKTVHVTSGSSGARVCILERPDASLVAVKVARRPRVSAVAQARARASIEPYLGDHLPGVLSAGTHRGMDFLITECPAIETLAVLGLTDTRGQRAWRDAVRTLTTVWSSTASPGYDSELADRIHDRRVRRGVDGLRHTLGTLGLAATSIGVNGIVHSLDRALSRLREVPLPEIHVACQGDPQPGNLLVARDGTWHLIDWEWAGLHHDWRMLTSHLLGWWYVQNVLTSASGQVDSGRTGVMITYGHVAPPPVEVIDSTAELFSQLSRPGRREADLSALAIHTALLLLRELPCHADDRGVAAVLLGEFLSLLTHADRPGAHALFDSFERSGPTW